MLNEIDFVYYVRAASRHEHNKIGPTGFVSVYHEKGIIIYNVRKVKKSNTWILGKISTFI